MVLNIDAVNPHWPRTVSVDTDQLIENQRFSRTGAPGPAPRPGLQWKEETHRWIREREDVPQEVPVKRKPAVLVSSNKAWLRDAKKDVEEFNKKVQGTADLAYPHQPLSLEGIQNLFSLPEDSSYSIHIEDIYTKEMGGHEPGSTNNWLHLKLQIRDEQNISVGNMIRVFKYQPPIQNPSTHYELEASLHNGLHVYHQSFFLDDEHQGKGIASSLNQHLDDEYRKLGVRSILLEADGDVGKYVWAVQGFDYAEDEAYLDWRDTFELALEKEVEEKSRSQLLGSGIPVNPEKPIILNNEWVAGNITLESYFKGELVDLWSKEPEIWGKLFPSLQDYSYSLYAPSILKPAQRRELIKNFSERWEYVPFAPEGDEEGVERQFRPLGSDEIGDGRARFAEQVHAWSFKDTITWEGKEYKPRILWDPTKTENSPHGTWFLDTDDLASRAKKGDGYSADELDDLPHLGGFRSSKSKVSYKLTDLPHVSTLITELKEFYHPWEFAQWNPFNEEDGKHFGKRVLLEQVSDIRPPQYSGIKYLQDETEPSYEVAQIYWNAKKKKGMEKQYFSKQHHPDGDTSEESQMNEVGENNDDLGDLTDPAFESNVLQDIREHMSNRPMSDRMLNSFLDRYFDEHEGLLEKQAVDTATRSTSSSAPGPPPRPGLSWKPSTHRWIRPGQSQQNAPRGKSGEQWWKPDQEGDERPILTVDGQRIPPAWKDLWVNENPDADRLATGVDEAGRSQTQYSKEYGKKQKAIKFARIRSFTKGHSTLVKQMDKDIDAGNEEAIVASLIDKSLIRPGSEKDTGAKQKAYGATTLLTDHVKVNGDEITLEFDSKKGGHTKRTITDKKLAKALSKRLRERQAGVNLFDTDADKVNDYIKSTSVELGLPGTDELTYTSKDFRTLGATKIALEEMNSGKYTMKPPPTAEQIQKKIDAINRRRTVPPVIPDKKKKVKGKLETDPQFKERVAKAKERRSKWKQQSPLEGDELNAEMQHQFELALNSAKKPIGEVVSEQLQNSPAMAITSYIDPHVFEDWNATYEDTQRRVISQLMGA